MYTSLTSSKYVGDFLFHETPEGDPVVCNEAAVFAHSKGKLFMYRNKDGDWVVGGVIGNNKKGVHLRSQDPDRSSFIHECPCQVPSTLQCSGPLGSSSEVDVYI